MGCNDGYCEIKKQDKYPEKRDLDGVYFMIQRDGRWVNVCFTDMTVEEREQMTKDRPAEWWSRLAWHLAGRLRLFGDHFDIKGEE